MIAAPAFDCARCGRHIGKTATHWRPGGTDLVLCTRCQSNRHNHARYYPDCAHGWHDMYDHPSQHGTRAGIAHVLGLWP